MSSYPILTIEGIGPVVTDRLKKAGVRTTTTLLARGGTPRGRKELATLAGIEERKILKWTNMADLMRIKGIGEEYCELLEAAGVDTVRELKHRNSTNLTRAMAQANAARNLVRFLPSEKIVAKWIEQAKTLPGMMSY